MIKSKKKTEWDMKTGIGNYYLEKYGLSEGARLMAEDGYEFADLNFQDVESEFYTSGEDGFFMLAGRYREALKKNGISVFQIHGPWVFPPKDGTEADRAELFGKMTKALGIARFFGAKYMAVHPLMPYGANSPEGAPEVYEINKKFFAALASVAGKLGVTLCLENMPYPNFPLSETGRLLELVRDIGSPHLRLCFDIGHANIFEKRIGDAIREAGFDFIKIIHAHDNLGDRDAHLPPYSGNVDFGDVCEALYDIGFNGVMNFETTPERLEGYAMMSAEEQRAAERELAKYARLLGGE